jgi:inactivated superfamily I helicase
MTTDKETNRPLRNKDAADLLKHIVQQVEATEDTVEVLAFVKIGREYHRFSTGIADMMKLIAVLEVAKHDCITRMSSDD